MQDDSLGPKDKIILDPVLKSAKMQLSMTQTMASAAGRSMSIKPEVIRPVGETELLITWSDGHRSLYHFGHLRFYCACAGCVDEITGRRKLKSQEVPENIRLLKMEEVGHYALKFHWSDGHQTGIYSYEYLRSLCRCRCCHTYQGDANGES